VLNPAIDGGPDICVKCRTGADLRKTVIDIVLLLGVAVIAALEFGAFPFLFPASGAGAAALIALAALSAPLHYGLMHETMHGNLFASERWNRIVGRALGDTLGLPFETMRFGHLAHHSNNRHTFDRPEHFVPGQSYPAAAAVYYGKLLIGNALIYTLIPLLTFLFNKDKPRLAGFPFFYWVQFAFIILGVGCTTVVYLMTRGGSGSKEG